MSEPILLEFDVIQSPFFGKMTAKHRDGFIRRDGGMMTGGILHTIIHISSNKVDQYIKDIKKHPDLIKFTEIYRGNNKAELHLELKNYLSIVKKILDNNCTLAKPCISRDGIDCFSIIASSNKDIKNLLKSIEDDYNIKIRLKKNINSSEIKIMDTYNASGLSEIQHAKDHLSEQQRIVFVTACDMGYYSCPKDLTLSDVALKLELSESTLRHHLRLAESKLFPVFKKVMKTV